MSRGIILPLNLTLQGWHTGHQARVGALINMRTIPGYRDWKQLRRLAVENKAPVSEDWVTQLPLIASRLGASRRVAAVLEDLSEMRNMVDRGQVVSLSDALEYIDAAEAVLRGWLGAGADIASFLRHRGG